LNAPELKRGHGCNACAIIKGERRLERKRDLKHYLAMPF